MCVCVCVCVCACVRSLSLSLSLSPHNYLYFSLRVLSVAVFHQGQICPCIQKADLCLTLNPCVIKFSLSLSLSLSLFLSAHVTYVRACYDHTIVTCEYLRTTNCSSQQQQQVQPPTQIQGSILALSVTGLVAQAICLV